MSLPVVEIYTDGACSKNPGPGGYGVILKYNDHIKELSGGFALTTNNRMELMAVIKGLEALKKPCKVILYTDSQYIVNAINNGWINKWKANNWMRSKNKTVKNSDLWKIIHSLASKHEITWAWIKGHDENIYNNRCDKLAVKASKGSSLPVDEGFIASAKPAVRP